MSKRLALLCGSFHKNDIEIMVAAAKHEAWQRGCEVGREVWVPGSMEKPLALDWLLRRADVDAVVILGVIERGQTLHGEVMGHVVERSYIDLSLKYQKPIGQGIIGPGALPEHLSARLEPYARAAVAAAARMLDLKEQLAG
jgi:6,7-dimethyl-8-ribityllumazine synthase